MKRKIIIFFYICLLFFLLFHPKEALTGVKNGLGLWLNIMIPTLLPFLILTGALLKNWKYPEASETICFLLENVFRAFTCWSLCSDPGSVMRISYGSQTGT